MKIKYEIVMTSKFRKEVKQVQKRGYNLRLLQDVILVLASGEQLDVKYRPHPLSGPYTGYDECHILPDWLLVYKREDTKLLLSLMRTGTHSDLL